MRMNLYLLGTLRYTQLCYGSILLFFFTQSRTWFFIYLFLYIMVYLYFRPWFQHTVLSIIRKRDCYAGLMKTSIHSIIPLEMISWCLEDRSLMVAQGKVSTCFLPTLYLQYFFFFFPCYFKVCIVCFFFQTISEHCLMKWCWVSSDGSLRRHWNNAL